MTRLPSRRRAREAALRALYEIEIGGASTLEACTNAFEEMALPEPLRQFAQELTYGVRANVFQIDDTLAVLIPQYSLYRLAAVDRSLLRLASFEILYRPAIPPAVTISEAVAIAKKYSTSESSRFVNGVLAKVLEGSDKKNWDPSTAPEEFEQEEPLETQTGEDEESGGEEPEEIVEEVEVRQGTEEEAEFKKVGAWTIRVKEKDERADS